MRQRFRIRADVEQHFEQGFGFANIEHFLCAVVTEKHKVAKVVS